MQGLERRVANGRRGIAVPSARAGGGTLCRGREPFLKLDVEGAHEPLAPVLGHSAAEPALSLDHYWIALGELDRAILAR